MCIHHSLRSIALSGVMLCLAGCFSLEKATVKTTNQEHVLVSNYGWFLFHRFPIACGNSSTNTWSPWVLFRNDVTMDHVQTRFMNYANGQGCDVSDLDYTIYESVMLNVPGLNLPMPIPYLITYREIQLSGILTGEVASNAHEPACAAEEVSR